MLVIRIFRIDLCFEKVFMLFFSYNVCNYVYFEKNDLKSFLFEMV